MKIYIVTSGCYSDREVVAAYTTPELAESAKKICDEDGDIIEMELDQMPAHEPGTKLYLLYMLRNGDVKQQPCAISAFSESEEVVEWTWETEESKKGWTFKVWARDEAHAVKIAGEKRAMLIAQPNDQAKPRGE